jgi:hypothetical protein
MVVAVADHTTVVVVLLQELMVVVVEVGLIMLLMAVVASLVRAMPVVKVEQVLVIRVMEEAEAVLEV